MIANRLVAALSSYRCFHVCLKIRQILDVNFTVLDVHVLRYHIAIL